MLPYGGVYVVCHELHAWRGKKRIWMDEHGTSAYPVDRKGKVYNLQNVQYEQARKWVLFHSIENVEWER